jgi:hypothetical protein
LAGIFPNILLNKKCVLDTLTTDETWLVEMRIWCIKIGIVLVLYISWKIQLLINRKIRPQGTMKTFTAFWLGLLIDSVRNCPTSKRGSVQLSSRRKKYIRVDQVTRNEHIFFFGLWAGMLMTWNNYQPHILQYFPTVKWALTVWTMTSQSTPLRFGGVDLKTSINVIKIIRLH